MYHRVKWKVPKHNNFLVGEVVMTRRKPFWFIQDTNITENFFFYSKKSCQRVFPSLFEVYRVPHH